MKDVIAYIGALVEGQPSEITLTDPDQQGDLSQYTPVITFDWPKMNWKKDWTIQNTIAIPTTVTDAKGIEVTVVNTLVLTVIPVLPPPGCLGRFIPSFPKWLKRWGSVRDPVGTGTLSGTLNPTPPPPPPPMGVGGVGVLPVRRPRKIKDVDKPLIFYGTEP
jgi:hypothetical protein